MTNTTFLSEAQPLIDFIVSKGGPKFPKWCDPKSMAIYEPCWDEDLGYGIDIGRVVVNRPAFVSAVCMWIMDVCEWCCVSKKLIPTTPYTIIGDNTEQIFWGWEVESYGTNSSASLALGGEDTKELAFLAMLKAICKALGYEGGES